MVNIPKIINNLTTLDILYIILGILAVSFFVEMIMYQLDLNRINKWKPDITKMHYIIKTTSAICIPHYQYDEENMLYIAEYKEMLSNKTMVKKVMEEDEFSKVSSMQTVDIQISMLRIYIATPNGYILHRDFTRTDRESNYKPFSKEDISFPILRISAEYFKKNCPQKKNRSKKKEIELKYLESLPYVMDIKK